jgi:HAMP domain-containing protein
MRTWIVALILVVLGGFIVYRGFVLESRVNVLSNMAERLNKSQSRGASESENGRLTELEARFNALTNKLKAIPDGDPSVAKNTAENLEKLLAVNHFDERVLSVLDAEKQKAIDAQLKWHRDAVVQYRMDSLNYFAADQKLSAGQLSALRSILEDEVDKLIEILRTPEMITNNEKGLAAWVQVIRQTDKDAAEVLNEQQIKVFRHFRRLEQQVLTPWLPEKDRS